MEKRLPHGDSALMFASTTPRTSIVTLLAARRVADDRRSLVIATSLLLSMSAGTTVIWAPESATASLTLNLIGPPGALNDRRISSRGSAGALLSRPPPVIRAAEILAGGVAASRFCDRSSDPPSSFSVLGPWH